MGGKIEIVSEAFIAIYCTWKGIRPAGPRCTGRQGSTAVPSWSCVPPGCPRSTHIVQQHPLLTSAHAGR
jgi:hypothetical protein